MFKTLVLLCFVCSVVVEARPKWQFLPPVPGYVPVYIQAGDTPLAEINPELAEAFHALPSGRSVAVQLEAAVDIPEIPEQADQAKPDIPEVLDEKVDQRPYEKKLRENKLTTKKAILIQKPIERR